MYDLSLLLTSIKDFVQHKPIEIHDIYLGSQTAEDDNTLHIVGFYRSINFFTYIGHTAQEYTPLGLNRSGIKKTTKNEIERITYRVDNVNKAMGYYAANKDFRNKRIVTRLIFRDNIETYNDCKVVFDGYLQSVLFNKNSMSGSAVPRLGSLDIETGWEYEIKCNATFGDLYCQIDKNAPENKIASTATGGSLYTLTDTIGLVQADDYWKHGRVTMTSGENIGQSRKVISFNATTHQVVFDYAFDGYIVAGDTFIIQRGCDKSLTTCINSFANGANYHGYHSIPLRK